MLIVSQIACPLDMPEAELGKRICRKLKINPQQLKSWTVVKRSLDARRDDVHFVYTCQAEVKEENKILSRKLPGVSPAAVYHYTMPRLPLSPADRPVIVGFGPAGLFAGLLLAEAGLKPLVLERGQDVDQRVEDVRAYWQSGIVNPESNVQFGEGGAGTFSDGKLTTRIKDPRIAKVTEELIEGGAESEIAVMAHPHIGTDRLRSIVKSLRQKIIRLGGEVRFGSRVTDILIENGQVQGVAADHQTIKTSKVILAIGHSARDTFAMLHNRKIAMEGKDFAVGFRIEHPQALIDRSQYGRFAGHPQLGSAEYRLTCTTAGGRGVYTFCMCPGGTVVASASEAESIVTNGMSEYARDQANANSAVLVQVRPSDFGEGVLDGLDYQARLEHQAWILGGGDGHAPAQRVIDYLNRQSSSELGPIQPSYRPGVRPADLHALFSAELNAALEEGLRRFDDKIPGFAKEEAVLTGPETRSSCPVRIVRGEQLCSLNTQGLYPCGEGAGYAGGIMTAAIDGLRIAEQVIRDYRQEEEHGL